MKLGIVGAGMIVHACLQTLKEVPSVQPTALWHRQTEGNTASQLAQENGIGRLYTDYDAFLADADVDVVYLGIINSMHYSFAKKALLAGGRRARADRRGKGSHAR